MARDGTSDIERELTMAQAQVAALQIRCQRLESIALIAMAALTEEQLGGVRDKLAQLDAGGESQDAPPDRAE
jgi:hypothetical protein